MTLLSIPANPVPEGALAGTIGTPDGATLRFARWAAQAGGRGTVCVFTGRGEYIERYFETVRDLHTRGYAVAVMDWRGQGHSSRRLRNPLKGHIHSFSDYEIDVAAIVRRPILHWPIRWAARSCCASRVPALRCSNASCSARR
jgi:lysophospholipase